MGAVLPDGLPRTEMEQSEVRWLHSAAGAAIAYVQKGTVFLADGTFLGRLEGNEVWNSHYVGEIFKGNRLVRKLYRPLGTREEPIEGSAPSLPLPEPPEALPQAVLPSDMRELEEAQPHSRTKRPLPGGGSIL